MASSLVLPIALKNGGKPQKNEYRWMNQLAFKGRDLAKDRASKISFLKTWEDSVIQCARLGLETGMAGFHFWCVRSPLCLRDWFKKCVRLPCSPHPFYIWTKLRGGDMEAEHTFLSHKRGQRDTTHISVSTCLYVSIFIGKRLTSFQLNFYQAEAAVWGLAHLLEFS